MAVGTGTRRGSGTGKRRTLSDGFATLLMGSEDSESTNSSMIGMILNDPEERTRKGGLCGGCSFCAALGCLGKMCLSWCCMTVLLIAIAIPFLLMKFPSTISSIANDSKMVLNSARMYGMTNQSLKLDLNVTIYDTGPCNAKMTPTSRVKLSYDGRIFGYTDLEPMSIQANTPYDLITTVDLEVTDLDLFRETASRTLSGLDNAWELSLDIDVRVEVGSMHMTAPKVNLKSEMALPPSALHNVITEGFKVTQVNETHMIAYTNISFYSYSVLKFDGPNDCIFRLRDNYGEPVGFSHLPALDIAEGFNRIEGIRVTIVVSPNQNEIFSRYVQGLPNFLTLEGPIFTKDIIIENLITQNISFVGTSIDIAGPGVITKDSLSGFNYNKQAFRGAIPSIHNPLNVPLVVDNLHIYVNFTETLSFNFTNDLLGGYHECFGIDQYAILFTALGFNQSNPAQSTLTIPPNERQSSFIPSLPQQGQDERFVQKYKRCKILDFFPIIHMKYSCCYVATSIAAACRALQNKDQPYFELKIASDFDIYVNGTFFISLVYTQDWLSLAFGNEMTSGFGADGFFKCKDFHYIS